MCRILCHFIWGTWWFHRSTNFEAVKTGKLATPPCLSCQYNVNTLVDLLSSWLYQNIFVFKIPMLYLYKEMPKLLICPLYYACCHLSKVCTLVFFYAYYLVNLVSFNYEFLGTSFNWNEDQSSWSKNLNWKVNYT